MKTCFQFVTLPVAIVIVTGIGLLSATAAAQIVDDDVQIEIVNQDGEQIQAAEIQELEPEKQIAKATASVSVEQRDGKLIITEADGTKREIDLRGAQSIVVNKSVKSVMENGQQKTQTSGKAIIIGPNGERQEIDLVGPIENDLSLPTFNDVHQADRVTNSYMIGVSCEPVGAALSAQLDLETGVGLVVLNVAPDSPAASAGVEKHDILMFADDRQLGKQSDLVEAVQIAGKEKTRISLSLLRAGKEIGVEVLPIERPAKTFGRGFGLPRAFDVFPEFNDRNFRMKWREFEPGIILGDDIHAQMKAQMDQMRAEMKELQRQFDDQIPGDKIK